MIYVARWRDIFFSVEKKILVWKFIISIVARMTIAALIPHSFFKNYLTFELKRALPCRDGKPDFPFFPVSPVFPVFF